MFNIAEFSSIVAKNKGYQRSALFSVEMPVPPILLAAGGLYQQIGRDLRFYCEGVNLPGIQLQTIDVNHYGYGPNTQKPIVPFFAGLDLDFLSDQLGGVYNFFEQWIKAICNFDSRKGMTGATGLNNQFPYELSYKKNYAVDININSFAPTGMNEQKKPGPIKATQLTIQQAYPIFLGDIQYNWGDSKGIVKIPIHFTFFDYYQTNVASGPRSAETRTSVDTLNNLIPSSQTGIGAGSFDDLLNLELLRFKNFDSLR